MSNKIKIIVTIDIDAMPHLSYLEGLSKRGQRSYEAAHLMDLGARYNKAMIGHLAGTGLEDIGTQAPVGQTPVAQTPVAQTPVVQTPVVLKNQIVQPPVVPNNQVVQPPVIPNNQVVQPPVVPNNQVVQPPVVPNNQVVPPTDVLNSPQARKENPGNAVDPTSQDGTIRADVADIKKNANSMLGNFVAPSNPSEEQS